jgi:ATP phosphoribosyltransferase regulatory subunit HisZ
VRFAAYAGGAPDAVLRGGRYDELLEKYGRAAQATGFAIDLEAVAQAQRSIGVAAPAARFGVAVDAPDLARALRQRGIRAVTQRTAPASWPAWLRGAGLDVAVVGDRLIRHDDSASDLNGAREDIDRLIALLKST